MNLIVLMQENPAFLYLMVGMLSLLIGSFLNAAIYRIPLMLEREWRQECEQFLNSKENDENDSSDKPFNLFFPRSQCPTCGHKITVLENIPVLSYLFLRGKCSSCSNKISIQYPLIELTTMLVSVLVAWKLGGTVQTLTALFFTWMLIILAMIDAKTMLLPDNLTLPLLWLGIVVNYFGVFVSLRESVLGAIAGYLSLWTIYQLFKLLTNKEGMGFGDFKLLAAVGAWGGWQILPFTAFLAALLGAVFGIALMLLRRTRESNPLPFGPWLALAGFIGLLWRDEIVWMMKSYFAMG